MSESENTASFQYEVTALDLESYHIGFLMNTPSTAKTIKMGQAAVGLTGLAILGAGMALGTQSLEFLMAMLISVAGCVILYPRFFERAARKRIQKVLAEQSLENTVGSHSLRLTADGLHKTGPVASGLIAWSRVRAVTHTPAHVVLHLDERNIEIIPASTFMGSAGAREFVSAIEGYLPKTP